MTTDVNVFFSIEGLVHINIKTDDPRKVDALAWKKFSELVDELPYGMAIGEVKVKAISEPMEKDAKPENDDKVTPDVPTGTYL